MENNKRKSNKKILLLILLIICITGLIGYGVYSYYYTNGYYETRKTKLHETSFYPELYNGAEEFLYGRHRAEDIECELSSYNSDESTAVYNCTSGSWNLTNRGNTPITLQAENFNLIFDGNHTDNINVTSCRADYQYGNRLEPGAETSISGICTITITNLTVDPSTVSTGSVFVDHEVYGVRFTGHIEFDMKASELPQ